MAHTNCTAFSCPMPLRLQKLRYECTVNPCIASCTMNTTSGQCGTEFCCPLDLSKLAWYSLGPLVALILCCVCCLHKCCKHKRRAPIHYEHEIPLGIPVAHREASPDMIPLSLREEQQLRRELARRLQRFYEYYGRSDKISHIPQIVDLYWDRQDELFKKLSVEYGPEPQGHAAVPPPAVPPQQTAVSSGIVQPSAPFPMPQQSVGDHRANQPQWRPAAPTPAAL